MKRLHTTFRVVDLRIVQALLEDHGIASILDPESKPVGFGEGAGAGAIYPPELWIVDEQRYAEAEAVLRNWQNPRAPLGQTWRCPKCGTAVGDQFTACWKCSTERAGV